MRNSLTQLRDCTPSCLTADVGQTKMRAFLVIICLLLLAGCSKPREGYYAEIGAGYLFVDLRKGSGAVSNIEMIEENPPEGLIVDVCGIEEVTYSWSVDGSVLILTPSGKIGSVVKLKIEGDDLLTPKTRLRLYSDRAPVRRK